MRIYLVIIIAPFLLAINGFAIKQENTLNILKINRQAADFNNDGLIDKKEFEKYANRLLKKSLKQFARFSKALDSNNDGVINKEETKKVSKQLKKIHYKFKALDKDMNWIITKHESEAYIEELIKRIKKQQTYFIARFDIDKNGELNENETKYMQQTIKRRAIKWKELLTKLKTKFDEDKDGKLNRTERKKMNSELEDHKKKARENFLHRFDNNKDGKLNHEELAKAREIMRIANMKRHNFLYNKQNIKKIVPKNYSLPKL